MRARGRIVLSQNQPPPTHHPTRYGLPDQPVAKTVGKNAGAAGDEASLDTQYIIATGQGVPTWWVYINGHTANPFASWVAWASNTSQLPLVHSLSVGEPEAEFQVCVRAFVFCKRAAALTSNACGPSSHRHSAWCWSASS